MDHKNFKNKIFIAILVISLLINCVLFISYQKIKYNYIYSQYNNFYIAVSNTLAALENDNNQIYSTLLFNYQANRPFTYFHDLKIGNTTNYVLKEFEHILKNLNFDKYDETEKLENSLQKIFDYLTSISNDRKLSIEKIEKTMQKIKPLIEEVKVKK